jgi:hypothetical protein
MTNLTWNERFLAEEDARRTKMLVDSLMIGSWLTLTVYTSWYLFKAKTFQPLTLEDLALTWQIHKNQAGCPASRIGSLLTDKEEVVGFRCECGYEFQQERLISQSVPKPQLPYEISAKPRISKEAENS